MKSDELDKQDLTVEDLTADVSKPKYRDDDGKWHFTTASGKEMVIARENPSNAETTKTS